MAKLESFDHAGWLKGLTLDFTQWDGVAIKILKVKPAKLAKVVKPAIHVLTQDNGDNVGRSLQEHRSRVDAMAQLYDAGRDLFTGNIVDAEGRDDLPALKKARNNEQWRETRQSAYTETDGLQLLSRVFKAQYDASDDD